MDPVNKILRKPSNYDYVKMNENAQRKQYRRVAKKIGLKGKQLQNFLSYQDSFIEPNGILVTDKQVEDDFRRQLKNGRF